ncbi:DEAD/DEAH box helicase [Neiella marina]|uniref:DEAD/DEAH box helicase n=1 Tax=Neiella holothuriorum TaxID=2870530 RepID=A0ABS7EDI3_9GAMM|nr:DEAD/DEAH box helicase [Neiella holothuriorum]MBW8190310.1 DEAD/DEAH box helicase [Neiella holothuriorum]
MSQYFSSLVEQSIARSQEATLSVLGITNPNLREHLTQVMSQQSGEQESFMAPPLFEHTFGWEFAKPKMERLKGNLLSAEVVDALDNNENGRYRFGADFRPFEHQLTAWQTLLDDNPKSVVVTSGTGSGKTECFMVPVINDLFREIERTKKPLVGVRALFLYPLNALINSQQERLDAWTRHFGGDMRYCLYNGNTENSENKMRSAQKKRPNEVLSRELLRKEPAPILVTNGTMLEYMLVRQADAPIIQQSRQQKSLRWIVLDEAHTYVGSQAAELSLQLRRVIQAFGVRAKDVRFVATSATIAGDDAAAQLQTYLANLAGVEPEQVKVIGGRRIIPTLDFVEDDEKSLEQLEQIEPQGTETKKGEFDPEIAPKRFEALSATPLAKYIRNAIVDSDKPQTLNEIAFQVSEASGKQVLSQQQLLRWIDLLTGTKGSASSEAFLKVRAHFFQRMTNGLFACIDSNCRCKDSTPLSKGWPFGMVYATQRQTCDCGAPVLELSFCIECNEPHLLARDKNGKLTQWNNSAGDEFSLQHEEGQDEDTPDVQDVSEASHSPEVFGSRLDDDGYCSITISPEGNIGSLNGQGYTLTHEESGNAHCCGCGFGGHSGSMPFRRAMLGAPFYIANVVPTLLEYCPDFDGSKNIGPQSLPARGRRLITFTDSRQGTARLSVRMQQEAERSKLRGAVVEILKSKQLDSMASEGQVSDGVTASELREQAAKLRALGMSTVLEAAEQLERQADALESGVTAFKAVSVSWVDMVQELARKGDFKGSMKLYNQYLSPEIFKEHDGSIKLADMLLFREYSRRPKRQNSSETQGLVKVSYQGVDQISNCPEHWESHGLTPNDWKDFLKVALDFYVRENNFLRMEDEGWIKWVGGHFSAKSLRSPESDEKDEWRIKRWPQIKSSQLQRLVKLLSLGSGLDASSTYGEDLINGWLRDAWKVLTEGARILNNDGNQFALDRHKMTFALLDKAYVCPVTNKLIDTTFKGYTPYLPRKIEKAEQFQCIEVPYPHLWEYDNSQLDYDTGLASVRQQTAEDDKIQLLRSTNLWTDVNDRALEGGFYYRTAEHSAQQSADRLDEYESMFKQGKINVLNCSTTMEMGVDIGGISAVVMNNVPPHPANYLQRAGRAGRSKESRAISYTLCKGNPHDQRVFDNPKWPFVTQIPAPYVAFNSERLVQRHVNSLLFSLFLNRKVGTTDTEKTKLNLEWFYLPAEDSVCGRLLDWLESDAHQFDDELSSLVKGTVLQHHSHESLCANAARVIRELQQRWMQEYDYLQRQLQTALKDSPYEYRINKELYRLVSEFVLRELASKSFLPGYGFPTDVVNFDNNNIQDFIRDKNQKKVQKSDRVDNVSRSRGLPSRNLAVAIREYAPGSEIVLDGRVFTSGGISLHWQNVHANLNEAQKFDVGWRCDSCGHTGYETQASAIAELTCSNPDCAKPIRSKHMRRVLQPAGFVTDFYAEPTNNIAMQKFIPVEPAWVSGGSAAKVSLPNPQMGHMLSSAEGSVFHHTSGEHGTGYALCMTCGRAESMDKHGHFPKSLDPSKPHRPLKALAKDKNGDAPVECDGSPTLMESVHLGAHTKTDVFELTLKHPVRNEYIPENTQGYVIATTLAVALRAALAEQLGISTSELGYAVRPAIVSEGSSALVIQLFDSISGGAGFASSAHLHVDQILRHMLANLDCSSCETACGDCLLESDTRRDSDSLDRLAAKQWLGADFEPFIAVPEELQLMLGGKYQPNSIAQTIRRWINKGASSVTFVLSEDINDWDLLSPLFRTDLVTYIAKDQVSLTLGIPNVDLDQETQFELTRLQALGANIATLAGHDQSFSGICAQVVTSDEVISLATAQVENITPGKQWLRSGGLVLESNEINQLPLTIKNLIAPMAPGGAIHGSWEVTDQFNGKLSKFGESFWLHLFGDKAFVKLLADDPVQDLTYSDRYQQSPASLLLIAQVIGAYAKVLPTKPSIRVNTLFNQKDRAGHLLHQDWQHEDDHFDVFCKWVEHKSNVKPELVVCDNRADIAHRRLLLLTLASGKQIKLKLDQGMGYWRLSDPSSHYPTVKFSFHEYVAVQLAQLEKLERALVVCNSEEWSTDISYTVL